MLKQVFKKLLIIGCGGHAKVITDIAKTLGISDFYYHDNNVEINKFLENEVNHNEINNYTGNYFVAIGDNFSREKVTNSFQKKNPNAKNSTLIHPSSFVSNDCSIGDGTVVMPQCVINSSSEIGKGVIINTKSSLDHDNYLMNFASIAPGVITGGNVYIGYRTSILIGSVVKNGIKISSDSVVGGASFVNKNIPENCLAYGNPVKVIKKREASEKYL